MKGQMIKDFGKGLKQIGGETVEKLVETPGKIVEPIITAQELLGDIRPMSDEEMAKIKAEDEQKKQKEMAEVKSRMSGRNIENEMEQIRHQKQREEEEKEKNEVENRRRMEEQQRQENIDGSELMMESSNPSKQKKSRGSAFVNKKKQQPDQSQMSQTSEFKGKID